MLLIFSPPKNANFASRNFVQKIPNTLRTASFCRCKAAENPNPFSEIGM